MASPNIPSFLNGTKQSDALLSMLVQSAGLVVVVVIAGINERVATLMLVFMIGLWMLFLIEHTGQVSQLNNLLTNIETGAKKA